MERVGRLQLEAALTALGELLGEHGEHFEVVLIGGGNLILQGLIARPTTKDLGVVGAYRAGTVERLDPMPAALTTAVADVGRLFGLASDWLNAGPESLLDFGLPDGFADRLERRDYGGLVVWLASRHDMVCLKLFAAVDQGPRSRHYQDLVELSPSQDELETAARWAQTHDPSPGFRANLLAALGALASELGHDEAG